MTTMEKDKQGEVGKYENLGDLSKEMRHWQGFLKKEILTENIW